MTNETKTFWKKNNDSRYISGEDLKEGIAMNKGLKPEMVVVISSFEDMETFDQAENQKKIKTGFILKDLNGNQLYKPVILNTVNAKFCIKEFGSGYIEDWVGKPLVLYAMADKRHGFVARFKKYYAPPTVTDEQPLKLLSLCQTLADLQKTWSELSAQEKNIPTVIAKKESLKTTLK